MDLIIDNWRGPTVILMDELEAALTAPALDDRFWWTFRALANHYTDGQLAFVTTSGQIPMALAHANDLSSPFFNIFQHLKSQIPGFNLSLFSGNLKGTPSWVYGRLCPRMIIPPWNISDINYFEKLHDEVMCVVSPEEFCKVLKPFFASYRDS